MKKYFSNKWKGSSQARKKRKYKASAPLHLKKKFVRANLSKDLRKKYGGKSFGIKKGDRVKIMSGQFRKKEGKVSNVLVKIGKITVEGIQRKKRDGSKVDIKLDPSNIQIIELEMGDKKREKRLQKEINIKQKKEHKDEVQENKK